MCSSRVLRDMDEWSLALLSCKIQLIGVNKGDIIKKMGEPSEYAYIIIEGTAKVKSDTFSLYYYFSKVHVSNLCTVYICVYLQCILIWFL